MALILLASSIGLARSATYDRAGLLELAAGRGPYLTTAFIAITQLGSVVVVTAAALLLTWWLWRRGARAFWQPALTAGVAVVASELLKVLLHRPRPDLVEALLGVRSYSYPSGHSFASAAFYGAAAVTVAQQIAPRWRRPLRVAAVLIIVLVGLSRVYLGVHYPSDVLGGFALGWLCVIGVDRAARHRAPL